jgi:outer membrane lipoprotein carrier protein
MRLDFISAALAAVLISVPVAVPLGAQTAARTAETPEQTLERAVAAYAEVRTVRASFEQTITNPLLRRTVTSRGEMVQERPKYVWVRFSDPAGDRIVADGRFVWLYLPSSNPGQVIKMPVGRNAAGTPDVTAEFLDSPKTRYRVADGGAAVVAGRPARALVLTPNDSTAPFRTATISVDDVDGLVRQFETTEASGLVRRVVITRLAINAKIDRTLFTFKVPKGVRVFEQ